MLKWFKKWRGSAPRYVHRLKERKIFSKLRTTISKGKEKKKHKRVIFMIKSVTLVDTKNNPSSILLL